MATRLTVSRAKGTQASPGRRAPAPAAVHPLAIPSMVTGSATVSTTFVAEGAVEEPRASGVRRIADALPSSVLEEVTLIVYGWKNVEPGTLSWVFPSMGAALTAAHAMTNAVNWAVVAGSPARYDGTVDVAAARASGSVLAER